MDATDDESLERELHERLLAGDPIAPSELARACLGSVVKRLKHRFPRIPDETLIWDACTDALLDYAERPHQFDPTKLRLIPYLAMAARGDLLNALEKEQRHWKRRVLLGNVEDAASGRNVAQDAAWDDLDEAAATRDAERHLEEVITGPMDRKLLELMRRGERRTSAFAGVLGIQALDIETQRRKVKQHKDRLKKRLERLGVKLREEGTAQ